MNADSVKARLINFAAPLLNIDNSDSGKWNPERRMWE